MAQRKIEIPVAITIQKDSLTQISSQLDKIAKSSTGAFNQDIKKKAEEINNLMKGLTTQFNKDSITGEMDPKKLAEYEKAMKNLLNQSNKLAKGIKDDMKSFDASQLEPATQAEYIANLQKIANAEKDILRIKTEAATQAKGFKSLENTKTDLEAAGIKLGNAKSLDAMNKKLMQDQERMIELEQKQGDPKFSKADKDRLELLKAQEPVRVKAMQDITQQIAVEDKYNNELKQTNTELELATKLNTEIRKKSTSAETTEQGRVATGIIKAVVQGKDAADIKSSSEALKDLTKNLNIAGGITEGVKNKWSQFVTGIASGAIAFRLLNTIYRQTWRTIRDLDKAFNEIAMVTVYTTQQAWQMKEAFTQIATTTGLTITQVANLSIEFFRQGRALSEVLSLTEAAGAAAKVANISVQESARFLTSAINAYKLSADQAMIVSDKFSALAQSSASSYQELATALSKVAAQAYSAGVNLDNMMGFIAKAIETTREAPENIGTAFKTIFARMSELKDFGKTLEDGTDVNNVDKALRSVGVSLRDVNGEIRASDEVLIDVGQKWSTLTKNQKAYITTALAGTRQQTRLLAVMEDFDRTMELTEISANSLGATFAQQSKYYDSISYAMNGLTVAWQNFITSLGSSTIIITVINTFKDVVESINILTIGLKDTSGVINLVVVGLMILAGVLLKTVIGAIMASTAAAASGATGWVGYAAAAKIATISLGTLANTMWLALGPIALVALAIGGVVLALKFFAEKMKTATQKNQEFINAMRKTQAEIFNLMKASNTLSKLQDEYVELSKKVNLTNEDIERQNQLLQQMQDLLGDEKQIVDIYGDIDLSLVEKEIERLAEEANKKFSKEIEETKKLFGGLSSAYQLTTDSAVRDQILIQTMIEKGLIDNYTEFLKLEKEKRKEYIATAKLYNNQNIMTQDTRLHDNKLKQTDWGFIDEKGNIVEFTPVIDNEALKVAEEKLRSLITGGFSEETFQNQIQLLENIDFSNQSKDIKNALIESIPELKGLMNLMDAFQTSSLITMNTILETSELTDKEFLNLQQAVSKTNLTLDEQTNILRIIAKEGPEALPKIIERMGDLGLSTLDTINVLDKVRDALDDISTIDISNSVTTLNSLVTDLDKFNKMMRGEEEWNLDFMLRLSREYEVIAGHIKKNEELSLSTIEAITKAEQEAVTKKIKIEIEQLKAEVNSNKAKIQSYKDILTLKESGSAMVAEYEKNINKITIAEISKAYNGFLIKKTDASLAAEKKIAINQINMMKEAMGLTQAEVEMMISRVNRSGTSISNLIEIEDVNFDKSAAITAALNKEIQVIEARNKAILNDIKVLESLQTLIIKNGSTLAKSKASEKMKELIDALSEIEKLLLRIDAIQGELDFLQASAVNLEGEELIHNLNAQIVLTQRLIQYQKLLIKEYQAANKATLDTIKLSPKMAKAVKLIDGRLVTTEAFLKLSADERKALMESIETYNDYADSINKAKSEVQNLIAAEQELIDQKLDMIDQTKQLVIQALREEMTARSDAAKKAYEEEKKWLDKRKEMYSDAFSEEDYANNLEEQNKKRQELIQQIAALEGATDLASVKRREQLLTEKAELDKTYNTTVRDYNREALLKSIDEEGKALDTAEEQREDAFQTAFDDMAALEAQATQMIKNSIDSTVAYLQLHSESYKNATKEAKDKMLAEWRDYVAQTNEIMTGSATDTGTNNTSVGTGTGTNVAPDVGTGTGTSTTTWGVGDRVRAISAGNANSDGSGGKASSTNTGYVKRNYAGKPYPYLMTKSAGGTDYLGWYKKESLTKYKKGGLIDYTGPAWVDGSAASPERVLTSFQTDLFHRMITALEKKQGAGIGGEPIYIDSINISTGQLNTNADFRSAGRELAKELKIALATGGIGINTKK